MVPRDTFAMRRSWIARLALALLVLVAEIAGRSLTHRIDVGRHVRVSYNDAAYYPFLVGAVKIGVALMLARLAWRVLGARRVASALGGAPRLRPGLSWRVAFVSFAGTAGVYLAQTGAERAAVHSSALPVFAVLAVVVAALYRTAERFLGDYERIAARAVELLDRFASRREPPAWPHPADVVPPRRLFGLAFESRPPPAPA